VFIGYAINSKVYRFYDLNAKVIIESNDANFYENKFPFKLRNSGGTSSSHLRAISSENLAQPEPDIEPRRGKRGRIAKDYGPDYMAYTLEEDPSNL